MAAVVAAVMVTTTTMMAVDTVPAPVWMSLVLLTMMMMVAATPAWRRHCNSSCYPLMGAISGQNRAKNYCGLNILSSNCTRRAHPYLHYCVTKPPHSGGFVTICC